MRFKIQFLNHCNYILLAPRPVWLVTTVLHNTDLNVETILLNVQEFKELIIAGPSGKHLSS
jgi:hypothetical protein